MPFSDSSIPVIWSSVGFILDSAGAGLLAQLIAANSEAAAAEKDPLERCLMWRATDLMGSLVALL